MSEDELQGAIVEYATVHGWLVYHTFDSRRSTAGFPDLVLVRPPRLIFVELKVGDNVQSPAQLLWAQQLELVSCATTQRQPEVYLWREQDWLSGDVDVVLGRRADVRRTA